MNNSFVTTTTVQAGPGIFSLSAPTFAAGEADGSARVQVIRDGGAIGAVTVNFATQDDTATAGSDYTSANTPLNFLAGETNKIVNMPIANGAAFECNETFAVKSSALTGGDLIGSQTNASVIMVEDEIRQTGRLTPLSAALPGPGGTPGDENSANNTQATPDGRFVVFESASGNLASDDTNGVSDVFVRDVSRGKTMLASVDVSGLGSGNGASTEASISADGRFVAFMSIANDLVANDTNATFDVFVRDLVTGRTLCASANLIGTPGSARSDTIGLSADGRYAVFWSLARLPTGTGVFSAAICKRAKRFS